MDFLINAKFNDFDHFAEATRGWQFDFVQLDRGAASFELLQAGVDGVTIARGKFSRKLLQRGQTPSGCRTFVIPATRGIELQWLGYQVTSNDILVFPEHGELDSCSLPGFDVITLSVPTDRIESLIILHQLPDLKNLTQHAVVRIPPSHMTRLRQLALGATTQLASAGAVTEVARRLIHDDLVLSVLGLLAAPFSHPQSPLTSSRRRQACVDAVIHLLEHRSARDITIGRLCEHLKVSERTLQYAFRDRFELSPKQFIKSWQLNQIRRALIANRGGNVLVSDIINRFDIWHLGQFAADYRCMFGELPTATLGKAG